jgi:hypothetical protein
LPNGAVDQNVNGATYFSYGGAYYRPIYSGSGVFGEFRPGAWALSKMGSDEEAHFLLMLAIMAVCGSDCRPNKPPGDCRRRHRCVEVAPEATRSSAL